jgi:hypothetical protein
MNNQKVKALVFDVFGTVVDWRGSMIAEGDHMGQGKGPEIRLGGSSPTPGTTSTPRCTP